MKIKVTSISVDDQEKALRFYTDILGLVKKADVTQGVVLQKCRCYDKLCIILRTTEEFPS